MTSARLRPMLLTSIWTSSAPGGGIIQILDFQCACITIFVEANDACHDFSSTFFAIFVTIEQCRKSIPLSSTSGSTARNAFM
jgi:hypothetical protein